MSSQLIIFITEEAIMPNCPAVHPTREQIEQHYIKEQLSLDKVAKIVGCRKKTVSKAVRAFGYEVRRREEKVFVGDNFGYLEVVGFKDGMVGTVVCRCRCGNIRTHKR